MVCPNCEALRDELDMLRRAVGRAVRLPLQFGLTRMEERFLQGLVARESLSKDQILDLLYCDKGHEPRPEITRVWALKVNVKLKPFGIHVTTDWGRGYRLLPEHKAKIAEMMQAELVAQNVD